MYIPELIGDCAGKHTVQFQRLFMRVPILAVRLAVTQRLNHLQDGDPDVASFFQYP